MIRFFCIFFLLFGSLCFGDTTTHYYINEEYVDMHEEPDSMAEVGSQAIYGTPVTIVENKNGWVKIQTPDNYPGWIKESSLISVPSSYPSTPTVAQVNILWTHIYYVDDTTPHPPAITLPFGTKVEVVSAPETLNQRWMTIRLIDGKTLSAQTTDFIFNPTSISLQEMLTLSKKFLGLPYRWGGNSSFGFDCSGFTQTLFNQMGIPLPRNASQQAIYADAIDVALDQMQPGDLIFFGKKKPKITHVGIYLGNDDFIQATTSNKTGPHVVQISKISTPEWNDQIIAIRRISLNLK